LNVTSQIQTYLTLSEILSISASGLRVRIRSRTLPNPSVINLWREYGPKREEVTGKDEHYMIRSFITLLFILRTMKRKDCLGVASVNGRMIFKWILNK
jgi:hypothetical protein